MALPKLSAQQPIVTSGFKPTPPFLQFMEKARTDQEATDATQDAILADLAQAQADIQAQVDALAAVLAGTTAFTGLNVGGTNVKPFLDNTDGTKIDTAAGLGSDVVTTPKVLAGAITPAYSALTTGAVLWSASSAEKDLQSVTVTVVRGSVKIDALANVLMDPVGSPAITGIMRLYRGASELLTARIALNATISSGGNWIFPPQWTLSYLDAPGAGTYTYKVTFEPGSVNSGQVGQRILSALPLEG